MILFKVIEIDMDAARARLDKCKFNKRQRRALEKLYDLFEAGKWQECLNHANDKKAFPYNERGEYPEVEHIGGDVSDVLRALNYEQFYTREKLLADAKEKLLTLGEVGLKS